MAVAARRRRPAGTAAAVTLAGMNGAAAGTGTLGTGMSGDPAPPEPTAVPIGGRSVATGPSRPAASDLAAAAREGAEIPDVVRADLDVLFCGINPGRWSGAVGHHFAHPGNRFWKLLHAAGFTGEVLSPSDERALLDAGLGITNLVRRTTATATELSVEELRAGAARLAVAAARWRPLAIAVLGLGAYRIAFERPAAGPGEQPDGLGSSALWVLPNPSGLQASYRFDEMVDLLRRLRSAAPGRRAPAG